jgi:hypothetical protein
MYIIFEPVAIHTHTKSCQSKRERKKTLENLSEITTPYFTCRERERGNGDRERGYPFPNGQPSELSPHATEHQLAVQLGPVPLLPSPSPSLRVRFLHTQLTTAAAVLQVPGQL